MASGRALFARIHATGHTQPYMSWKLFSEAHFISFEYVILIFPFKSAAASQLGKISR
ncbi:hypothetical protein ACQ4W6_19795 [Janthinobacterium sp. HLX7-2]